MLVFIGRFRGKPIKMFSTEPPGWDSYRFFRKRKFHYARRFVWLRSTLLVASAASSFFCTTALAQQTDLAKPVVVQPGAPGQPSKTLPPSTKGAVPPQSQADAEFMQGMIMHHSQAVEMTA